MWKSIINWPPEAQCLNNQSDDKHVTAELGIGVIRMLQRLGLGCEGKFFPVSAFIEGPSGSKTQVI